MQTSSGPRYNSDASPGIAILCMGTMSKPFWKTCTVRVRRAVYGARYEASRLGNRSLEPYHLLLALLREDWDLVRRLLPPEAEAETIRRRLESQFKTNEK